MLIKTGAFIFSFSVVIVPGKRLEAFIRPSFFPTEHYILILELQKSVERRILCGSEKSIGGF